MELIKELTRDEMRNVMAGSAGFQCVRCCKDDDPNDCSCCTYNVVGCYTDSEGNDAVCKEEGESCETVSCGTQNPCAMC